MRSESEITIALDRDELNKFTYPTTQIYKELIAEGVPIKWKGGKPPADRDATEADIKFGGVIKILPHSAKAQWS